LAKFALSEKLRGQDPAVGPDLLLAALEVVLKAANLVGGRFLVVDTQNTRAFKFYQRNGFVPVQGVDGRLIIKMSAIRSSFA
jgi:ribosomal protein S18 acetylase RimI-like enzyme